MSEPKPHRSLLMLSPQAADGSITATILLPKAGWHYMVGGFCHDIDLSSLGIPMKIVIGRCIDRDDGMRMIQRMAAGVPTVDLRGVVDLSIRGIPRDPSK